MNVRIETKLGGLRDARLAAAERELVLVHRIELAWLLREATRIALARVVVPAVLEACRAGLLEALAAADADGLRLPRPTRALADRLAASERAAWPAATRIAWFALVLEPCAAGRAGLARALESDGGPVAGLARARSIA